MPVPAPAPRADTAYRRLLGALACGVLLVAAVPRPAYARQVPPPPPSARADSARVDTTKAAPARGTSPRGAFLRAVALPGWGHASIGAYNRGAFYVAVEGMTGWALVKARGRYAEAGRRIAFRDQVVRAQLASDGETDPAKIQDALDADEILQDLMALKDSRRQQREDWTALWIFLLLLSGADAYVSTHLEHFPQPISVDAQPVGNGRMEVSLSFTLPR
jgi:hypothetical protein